MRFWLLPFAVFLMGAQPVPVEDKIEILPKQSRPVGIYEVKDVAIAETETAMALRVPTADHKDPKTVIFIKCEMADDKGNIWWRGAEAPGAQVRDFLGELVPFVEIRCPLIDAGHQAVKTSLTIEVKAGSLNAAAEITKQ